MGRSCNFFLYSVHVEKVKLFEIATRRYVFKQMISGFGDFIFILIHAFKCSVYSRRARTHTKSFPHQITTEWQFKYFHYIWLDERKAKTKKFSCSVYISRTNLNGIVPLNSEHKIHHPIKKAWTCAQIEINSLVFFSLLYPSNDFQKLKHRKLNNKNIQKHSHMKENICVTQNGMKYHRIPTRTWC